MPMSPFAGRRPFNAADARALADKANAPDSIRVRELVDHALRKIEEAARKGETSIDDPLGVAWASPAAIAAAYRTLGELAGFQVIVSASGSALVSW